LLPGAWLLDGLELRLVNPARGEVVRPAEWFERTLGPVGAVAILAGFVTLLHTSGFSYELALYDLGLWAVRLFPAVFGAVCVYRLAIEPQVLPGLDAWCAKAGIDTRKALPAVLGEWVAPKGGTREGLSNERVGLLTHARRTGMVGATGSQNSFRVSRSVGRNVRAVGTSRRSTSAMTVDSTKSSARPRFPPRGPIACVPPWKPMCKTVPPRFVYTRGIAFSRARAGRILSKNGFEVAGDALMMASNSAPSIAYAFASSGQKES